MNKENFSKFSLFFAGLFGLLFITQAEAVTYQVQRLANATGINLFLDFNDSATAVGQLSQYNNGFLSSGLRWAEGDAAPVNIGNLHSNTVNFGAAVFSINNPGVAVGSSDLTENNVFKGKRAVRWGASDIEPTTLGTLGTDGNGYGYSDARRVNDNGAVVGQSILYENNVSKGYQAVRWDAGDTVPTKL